MLDRRMKGTWRYDDARVRALLGSVSDMQLNTPILRKNFHKVEFLSGSRSQSRAFEIWRELSSMHASLEQP
jgi:hypothetical protein